MKPVVFMIWCVLLKSAFLCGMNELAEKTLHSTFFASIHGDINASMYLHNWCEPPLHLACRAGDPEIIAKVLEKGAHVGLKNKHGETAHAIVRKKITDNYVKIFFTFFNVIHTGKRKEDQKRRIYLSPFIDPLQKIVFLTKHTHSGRAFVQLSPSLHHFVNTHDSKFHLFVIEKDACAACADLKKNNILSEMRAFVDKIIHTSPDCTKEWRALEIRHCMQENVKLEKLLEKLV